MADRVGEMRMSLGEHIEELRRRLILALAGIVAALVVTFYFGFDLIAWLASPMIHALAARGFTPQTYVSDPTAGFTSVYLKVSVIAAIIVASPWVVYQIWRFIVEGLYENERRAVYILWPFSVVMTVLGVLFTYYLLLPVCLMFFLGFAQLYPPVDVSGGSFIFDRFGGQTERVAPDSPPTDAADTDAAADADLTAAPSLPTLPLLDDDPVAPAEGSVWINRREGRVKIAVDGGVRSLMQNSQRMLAPLIDIGRYLSFAAMMGLGVVIAFQLPVIMLVVGWTGLIDPDQIARGRRYALFICFAIGAVLTPADLLSMFILAVPLYALFEFGLLLMRFVDPVRRRDEPDTSTEA